MAEIEQSAHTQLRVELDTLLGMYQPAAKVMDTVVRALMDR